MSTPFFAPERFVSDGFLLRSWRPGDGERLAEATNASLAHLSPWMAWAREPSNPVEAEARCRAMMGRYLQATDFVLGVLAEDDERVLGGTGFHLREGPLENGAAEIGMWIHADAAGSGLGTRVLRAMLRWGFSEWPWHRLSWRCDTRNLASVRVAEKAGMLREGTLRQHERAVDGAIRDTACFAALRDEWSDPVG